MNQLNNEADKTKCVKHKEIVKYLLKTNNQEQYVSACSKCLLDVKHDGIHNINDMREIVLSTLQAF
jgi:hypothetical protein